MKRLRTFGHLKNVPLEDYVHAVPKLLIGLDNYQLLIAQPTIEGSWDEPVAVKTRLRWTIYGNVMSSDATVEASVSTHRVLNDELQELVNR